MNTRIREKIGSDVDLTPMVDVTFLLLIFFMVTASFMVQKSFKQSPADGQGLTPVVITDEQIEVVVDADDNFYVITNQDEILARSDREMRVQLRSARESNGADRMLIKAHVDSTHSKVVKAWDAGVGLGIDEIRMITIDEEY